MARTATAAAAPRAPGFLRAALLLLLLVAACRQAAEEPVVNELRCQCMQTMKGIHPKNIQSVKVTSPGTHCDQTEVIAILKNGQKVCLNPASPMVKKFVNKLLNKEAQGIAEGVKIKQHPVAWHFLPHSILSGIGVKEEKQRAPGATCVISNVYTYFK
uniref:C-X-C motif chemokine n=1 Tax=Myotis lucifugus TaxID=59463 RepID=G1Q322_MYOLU